MNDAGDTAFDSDAIAQPAFNSLLKPFTPVFYNAKSRKLTLTKFYAPFTYIIYFFISLGVNSYSILELKSWISMKVNNFLSIFTAGGSYNIDRP